MTREQYIERYGLDVIQDAEETADGQKACLQVFRGEGYSDEIHYQELAVNDPGNLDGWLYLVFQWQGNTMQIRIPDAKFREKTYRAG